MPKNPYLAALLSFIFAGLGQLYVGRIMRGILFLAADLASSYAYLKTDSTLLLAVNMILSVYSMVDAFKLAKNKEPEKKEKTAEKMEVRAY